MRHSFRCGFLSGFFCLLILTSAPSAALLAEDGSADIQVEVSGPSEAASVGDVVEFRITVRNDGPSVAEGVDLANHYSAGAVFVAVFPESANCSKVEGPQVLCQLGALEPGQEKAVELQLKPEEPGGLVVESAADPSNVPDPNTENNSGRKEVEVAASGADVQVVIEASQGEVPVGGQVSFFVTVTNRGPSTAEGVDLGVDFNEKGSFVFAELEGGGCQREGRHLLCALGTLQPEESKTVELRLEAQAFGGLVVEAGADPSNVPDPITENNSARKEVDVFGGGADVQVVIDPEGGAAQVGDIVCFFIAVSNRGPETAEGVDLGAGFNDKASFVSARWEAGECERAENHVQCALGTLAPEESVVVELKLKAEESGGMVVEAAADPSNVPDPNTENNSDRAEVPVGSRGADLSVSVSDSPDPVASGARVNYRVNVQNLGPGQAFGVDLSIVLPEGGELVSAGEECRREGRELFCPNVKDLNPGQRHESIFVVEALRAGEMVFTARAHAEQDDPNPENNSDRETTLVESSGADLKLSGSAPDGLVLPGDPAGFSFRIANQGPEEASRVRLSLQLPQGTESASAGPGDCSREGSLVECALGSLAAGQVRELDLKVEIGPEADGPVTVVARVSSDNEDPEPEDNVVELSALVNALADLKLDKQDQADPVGREETIVYLLKLGNKGPSQARGVEVVDELPETVEFVSAEAEDGHCEAEGRRVVCSWERVGPRQDRLARIEARPLEEGSVRNFAVVRSQTDDPDDSNNRASEDTQIGDQGDADGVADVVEDAAPNGGDGNSDGIPDRSQSNVASLPSSQTGEYLTVISRPGSELVEVQAEAPPEAGSLPEGVELPLGGLSFACRDMLPGQGTTITILVHGEQSFNSYLKFGPTPEDPEPHWYDFVYDGSTGAKFDGNRITLFLVDGLRGDDDLQANGEIVDPGAPAADQRADLLVSYEDFPVGATAGQEVGYSLSVRNDGQSGAESVQLTSLLPERSFLLAAEAEQGSCAEGQGALVCQLGLLPPGSEVRIELRLVVGRPGRMFTEAEVSSPRLESQEENNRSEAEAPVEPPLLLPLSLGLAGTPFEDSFVGMALFNPLADLNTVRLSGLSLEGSEREQVELPALGLENQSALLAGDLLSDPETVMLRAEGLSAPLQGFFLAGDFALTRMDGLGGRLDESSLFHFPALSSGEGSATLIMLHNPGPGPAQVSLVLRTPSGEELARAERILAPQGSLLSTAGDLFSLQTAVQEGSLTVESNLPLRGFEMIAQEAAFAALPALEARPVERLLAPHFFVDSQGGTTVLRLLNRDAAAVRLQLRAFDDQGAEAALLEREIPPGALLVEDLGETIQPVESGIASGHLRLDLAPAEESPARPVEVLGAVSFQGAGYRSMLPLVDQGRPEHLFLQVFQSQQEGVFTGCAVLNAGDQTALATLRAFDAQGNLSSERQLEIAPGARLVDLLDGPAFFGPAFEQQGGRFEITSDQPLVSFALFGDYGQNFLAAVESQQPIR